jgi:hypothetical protein
MRSSAQMHSAIRNAPLNVCAAFQWVQAPPGQPLQPEANGAVMEVTKWLKPSM